MNEQPYDDWDDEQQVLYSRIYRWASSNQSAISAVGVKAVPRDLWDIMVHNLAVVAAEMLRCPEKFTVKDSDTEELVGTDPVQQ